MLSLNEIDMDMLTTAMENHGYDFRWWLDPQTGQLDMAGDSVDDALSEEELEERGAIFVEPVESHEGCADMEDFIDGLEDQRAREALLAAINRSRPFRHFKDTLYDFPELQDQWYAFHEARMRRRAIEWLVYVGVVDEQEAQRALEE
ncbi:UPF0158 family protein [Arthrobacter sp. I2-34]|uniref:UPF0158 family protein n=1 Tax=Arthrobacter hankyongi TaxID=2904801 RepID=A0ABS9L2M2_9MICC|nr:UPF0158 family protein [Arthrobacter hankyongi]MCG2620878.1 UPF0158 family protein [Arthrobacter hankyongi]